MAARTPNSFPAFASSGEVGQVLARRTCQRDRDLPIRQKNEKSSLSAAFATSSNRFANVCALAAISGSIEIPA